MTEPKSPRRKHAGGVDTMPGASTDKPTTDSLPEVVRRRFPHIGIAITILVGLSAGLEWTTNVFDKLGTVREWMFPAPPILPYVEILLDRSARMSHRMDDGPTTKWAAAKQAMRQVDIFDNEYVALRSFAGSCADPPGHPDMGFMRDGKAKLNAALDRLEPAGAGNLGEAIIAAIGDLIDKPEANGVRPRVVVITGGGDECADGQGAALEKLQGRYGKIEFDFRYVGVQPGAKGRQDVEAIKTQTKGDAVYVDNARDIDRAVNTFLVWEPMEKTVGAMLAALNGCVLRLNKVAADLREPGAGTADADFRVAGDECRRSDQAFRDLGDRQLQALGPEFARIYQQASANREQRNRIVGVMERLIASAKSNDVAGYKTAYQDFAAIGATYNTQVDDLYGFLDHLKLRH